MKTAALFFALFLLGIAVGDFVPALAPNGLLFGIFLGGRVHNALDLIAGGLALFCAFAGVQASRRFFQIFGSANAIFALAAALSYSSQPLRRLIEGNKADIGLHFAIAVIALVLGFAFDPFVSLDRESLYF